MEIISRTLCFCCRIALAKKVYRANSQELIHDYFDQTPTKTPTEGNYVWFFYRSRVVPNYFGGNLTNQVLLAWIEKGPWGIEENGHTLRYERRPTDPDGDIIFSKNGRFKIKCVYEGKQEDEFEVNAVVRIRIPPGIHLQARDDRHICCPAKYHYESPSGVSEVRGSTAWVTNYINQHMYFKHLEVLDNGETWRQIAFIRAPNLLNTTGEPGEDQWAPLIISWLPEHIKISQALSGGTTALPVWKPSDFKDGAWLLLRPRYVLQTSKEKRNPVFDGLDDGNFDFGGGKRVGVNGTCKGGIIVVDAQWMPRQEHLVQLRNWLTTSQGRSTCLDVKIPEKPIDKDSCVELLSVIQFPNKTEKGDTKDQLNKRCKFIVSPFIFTPWAVESKEQDERIGAVKAMFKSGDQVVFNDDKTLATQLLRIAVYYCGEMYTDQTKEPESAPGDYPFVVCFTVSAKDCDHKMKQYRPDIVPEHLDSKPKPKEAKGGDEKDA
jgi:hypothetical protein